MTPMIIENEKPSSTFRFPMFMMKITISVSMTVNEVSSERASTWFIEASMTS
jgi:hypothetical protein